MGGNHDHPGWRLSLSEEIKYTPTVYFRHEQVRDDKIKMDGSACFNRLLSVLHGNDFITLAGEGLRQGPSNQEFILGNEYFRR